MSSNTEPCKNCSQYWPLEKGVRGGARKKLDYGYCLQQTVFAANKVGDPVYPPRAKTAILPYARHKIKLVRPYTVQTNCQHFSKKGRQ